MEMALNRLDSISNNNIMAEKKAVELTLIVNNKSIGSLADCEDMCDGDIWQWNLIYGIGNDVY